MADGKGFSLNEHVEVTEEVISIIAGIAATEVDGIKELAGGIEAAMVPKSGASKLQKAIRIAVNAEGDLVIRVSVVLDYGYEIPEVCEQAQERVKNAVENMTGLNVADVDIRIASVEVDG